jgi:hypothetical protein
LALVAGAGGGGKHVGDWNGSIAQNQAAFFGFGTYHWNPACGSGGNPGT